MLRRLLPVVALALLTAPGAAAHAIPVSSSPGNGAVLASAPGSIVVRFNGGVHVGPRNAAIRNDGVDVLAGRARIEGGRTLVLPLQAGLRSGNYSARWSIVSDDGHEQEGVLAFAAGPGAGPPVAALTTRVFVTWQRVVMRTLFLLGILGAAGTAFFAIAILRPLGLEGELRARQSQLLCLCFLLAFLGSDALLHTVNAAGTRFELFTEIAVITAGVGAVAAILTPHYPRLRFGAWAAAALLLVCPTLSGHALDPGQVGVVTPLVDLIHSGAAAVWLGGLASLAWTTQREVAARRFSALALVAVALLALAGLTRALTELASFSQLWSTSYGHALLVKTAVFLPLLALGWRNGSRLGQVRRTVLVELLLLTVIVVAVATLTDLPPGYSGAVSPAASR